MAEVQTTTPSDPIVKDQQLPAAHHDSEEYESAEEVYEEEEEVEVEEEVEEEEEDLEASGERDLDDDEDRKNPQFIPKKGYFYEHDDRTQADEENPEAEQPEDPLKEQQQKVKKTGKEADKWTHDLYDDDEQAGKSKEEIIETYGYDIRADDQAPKAVRRRRYGRDPRKYTRKSDEVGGGGGDNRRSRGSGGYRGSRGRRGGGPPRRGEGEDAYEENFPSLIKPSDKGSESFEGGRGGESNRGRSSERGNIRGGRGGGKPPPPPRSSHPRASYHDDRDDGSYRDRNNYSSERGGGRGGGGGGGRGRRNEFTNRNRYRDRREPMMNEPGPPGRSDRRNDRSSEYGEPRFERRSEQQQQHHHQHHHHNQHDDRRVANGSDNKGRNEGPKPAKPTVLAPFTNTEYTGSASLTAANPAVKGAPEVHRSLNGAGTDVDLKKVDPKGEQQPRRPQTKGTFQNERRSQIPPRMMQQDTAGSPAAVAAAAAAAGKPKKFSTQRQRQVVDPPGQPPSSASSSSSSQIIPQVVPVSTPVVTGAGPMVPSPIPNYTPQQPYFEAAPGNFEAQVYETAGSPMTGNGPSVSPSLWGPHAAAFATAPYPSPPTGSQVPVQQQAYGDPAAAYIAAPPQPGPTIYAAPPQFIQDPTTLLTFPPGPGPQFGAPFHPQGFQGYAQVTPGPPPPEVYHAGVTYYNTHNQMQRPPVVAVQKRPKTVLQLVEPPEKVKGQDVVLCKAPQQQQQLAPANDPDSQTTNEFEQQQEQEENLEKPVAASSPDIEVELVSKFSNMATGAETNEDNIVTEELLQVSTSPQQPDSWAAEVDQMSPIEKSPPISIIPEPADQVVEETHPKPAQVENSVSSVVEESEPKVVVMVVEEEAEKKQIIMESSSSGPEGGDSIVESKETETEVKEQVSNNLDSSVKAN